MALLRTFTVNVESNQLRGLEAAMLITVHDQHGTCWDDVQISREDYDSHRAYRKAVQDKVAALRETWKDEYSNIVR
jgi:hypothetical protein